MCYGPPMLSTARPKYSNLGSLCDLGPRQPQSSGFYRLAKAKGLPIRELLEEALAALKYICCDRREAGPYCHVMRSAMDSAAAFVRSTSNSSSAVRSLPRSTTLLPLTKL